MARARESSSFERPTVARRGRRNSSRRCGRDSIRLVVGLHALFWTVQAQAHPGPGFLPPVMDYVLQWYQPVAPHPVEDWDVEVVPFDTSRPAYTIPARASQDTFSCWLMHIPSDDGPVRVRMRAVQGGETSAWTDYRTVPEPSVGVASSLGALVVALLGHRRRRRAVARAICG